MPIFRELVRFTSNEVVFNGTTIVNGILQNKYSYGQSYTMTVNGDIINNGTITNHGGNNFSVNISGKYNQISGYWMNHFVNISQDIEWGVSFSKYSAEASGLNWREVYLAILDDLKPKSLRLPIYWREVEPETGEYYFDDYDWLVTQAEEREVKLILVIGSKAPRWPKRQLPDWAVELDEPIQQSKILDLNSKILSVIGT